MDLTITCKLDGRVSHPPGIVVASIAIDEERKQGPQCRDVGDRLTALVRPVNIGADKPAERAVLIEHGTPTHPSVETSTDPVARKGQHDSITVPFMNLAHDADARHEFITQHLEAGNIRRIARDVFASVPKHEDVRSWSVDRFLVDSLDVRVVF